MSKIYISEDIEASGPTPSKYSILSIGACVIGDTGQQFYRELKPISMQYSHSHMEIASLALRCLEQQSNNDVDPHHPSFTPLRVLEVLMEYGTEPKEAMTDYAEWIISQKKKKKDILVEAAGPIKFDGAFVSWYFEEFVGENPFGHSGEDLNSVYRGLVRNEFSSMKQLGMRGEVTHNALEDAVQQAKEFEIVLDTIRLGSPHTIIPREELVPGQWYVGRGRNNNVGLWDGSVFVVISYKMRKEVIKFESHYDEPQGCFQPFRTVDEGTTEELVEDHTKYAKIVRFK